MKARLARLAARSFSIALGVLVPGLVTWLLLGRFVPVAGDDRLGSFGRGFVRIVSDYAIPVGALLFLAIAALYAYVARDVVQRLRRARLEPARDAESLQKEPPSTRGARARRSLALVATVAGAAIAALLLRSSLFQSYRVLSASMLPVLRPGDEIVVDKRAYGFRLPGTAHRLGASVPKRGDVIVFGKLVDGRREELVKRVIGLPGDRITMEGGRALINGWQIPSCDAGRFFHFPRGGGRAVDGRLAVEFLEDRVYLTALTPMSPPFDSYVVKPGELFVLGDNRNESSDSRVWNGGRGAGVPLRDVEGRSSRKLLGVTRAGRLDFSVFLAPIGTDIALEGVDVRPLEANIRRCLAQRPARTRPPASR